LRHACEVTHHADIADAPAAQRAPGRRRTNLALTCSLKGLLAAQYRDNSSRRGHPRRRVATREITAFASIRTIVDRLETTGSSRGRYFWLPHAPVRGRLRAVRTGTARDVRLNDVDRSPRS